MRYCEKCGCVIDEFDPYRDKQNCPVCSGVWSEDDMTALKYAELSESEKDSYDEQLLNIIKNSPNFDESLHRNCSTKDGQWWGGFRVDKYAKYESEERIIKSLIERRKANEPFKPFPPVDTVKAREVAKDAEITHKAIERGYYSQNKNVPRCPICQSTDLKKLGKLSFMNSFGVNMKEGGTPSVFPVFGVKRNDKTWKCNNCGSKF